MSLGLTNGTENFGLSALTNHYTLSYIDNAYGVPIQNIGITTGLAKQGVAGITGDPTKSGIAASFSNIIIGNINSVKLGKYLVRY